MAHEAMLDKSAQDPERLAARIAHLLDLWEHRARDEHPETREEALLAFVQEVPAPGDRATQRPLPLREIASRRCEHVEPLSQLGQHRLRGQDLDSCGGELDRERQSVEA